MTVKLTIFLTLFGLVGILHGEIPGKDGWSSIYSLAKEQVGKLSDKAILDRVEVFGSDVFGENKRRIELHFLDPANESFKISINPNRPGAISTVKRTGPSRFVPLDPKEFEALKEAGSHLRIGPLEALRIARIANSVAQEHWQQTTSNPLVQLWLTPIVPREGIKSSAVWFVNLPEPPLYIWVDAEDGKIWKTENRK